MTLNRAGSLLAASASCERASGRQAWGLLWASSRPLAAGVIAWMVANALFPVTVVVTLGLVVASIPGTVNHGISSSDGHRLIAALILDEPTAALDVRSEARFYRQFLDITAGLTTVVISHRARCRRWRPAGWPSGSPNGPRTPWATPGGWPE